MKTTITPIQIPTIVGTEIEDLSARTGAVIIVIRT